MMENEMMPKGFTAGCEDREPEISFSRRKELMELATKIAAQMNGTVKRSERHILRRMVDLLCVD